MNFMRAYYAVGNTAVDIACNAENYVARGFEFYLSNPASLWHSNNMFGNAKAFVLNNTYVGRLGSPGAKTNNIWYGGNTYDTYVYNGADANKNPMYVDYAEVPTLNGGVPFFFRYIPGTNTHTTGGPAAICPPPVSSPYLPDAIAVYEDMVRQNIVYITNVMPTKWINQFELWKTLQTDTTLVDSSAALMQFATMAANSRYAYLTNIETQLAYGNIDSAMTMLTYDIDSMANTDTDAVTGVRMADSTAAR